MKTHLEPKEVLHLKELGVEFENTTLKWVRPNLNDMPDENREEWARWQLSISFTDDENICEILPAPCLSEVLEKLPKYIIYDSKKFWQDVYYTNKQEWSIGYKNMEHLLGLYNDSLYKIIGLKYFYNSNPLQAAYELLCWCAENNYLEN